MRRRVILFSLVGLAGLVLGWEVWRVGGPYFFYYLVLGNRTPSVPAESSGSGTSPQPTERSSTSGIQTEETTALKETTGYQGPPHTTLSYGGRQVRGELSGSYFMGGLISDGIIDVPPRKQTLYVPSGSVMVFRIRYLNPPNKVSASAIVLLGKVNTNGGGLGRERSLEAHGSGMERAITAELPPDEYLVGVQLTAPEYDLPYFFRVKVQ